MQKYAIVVAGGVGSRMQASIPKQFLLLNDIPIIIHTLSTFLKVEDIQIIVAITPSEKDRLVNLLIEYQVDQHRISIVTGGKTRFHSVKNALNSIQEENGLVAVHDAVRPLVSLALIQKCFSEAGKNGTAIPCLPVKNSIRKVTKEGSFNLERTTLRIIQTPQTFQLLILKNAFLQPYQELFTDDATVIEKSGISLHLIEGEEQNIKITTPTDLKLAETISIN